MTQAFSQRVRRRRVTAQSLTVAISVLFLLLFLGGIFIAIVINNLRGARTSAKQTASSRFAQGGLEYMDRQLSEAPEGADWRPRPDFANGAIDPNDPDFDWLRPCNDPSIDPLADPAEPCGFTRVNQGGDDPTVGNLGGRALVRVSYLPYRPLTAAGSQIGDLWDDTNRNGTFDGIQERVCRSGEAPGPGGCIAPDPTRKYIKLESVGRAGIVVTGDPTTYARSQGKALLYQKVGYKSIGLNEYVRYITNKDGSPTTASLGAMIQMKDAPAGTPAARPNTPNTEQAEPRLRDIPSIYYGPIRSNASLRFYGPNYLFLDPRRNDALEVAGLISLANVADGAVALPNTPQEPVDDPEEAQSQANPGRVWVTNIGATGSIPPGANPNVFPSGSGAFTTLGGVVRDNAAGVGTPGANLRHVARLNVPLIDLARYRSITQGSEAMALIHTGPNRVGPAPNGFTDPNYAGTIGWGANMYIGNAGEVNRPSNALVDAYSPRVDWLTPGGSTNWQTGFKYEPPGVTITFTPRFIILERTATRPNDPQQRPFAFRLPGNGDRLTNTQTIIRYTDLAGGPGAPAAGIAAGTPGFAGYPALPIGNNIYQGDFTIFAEGNIRVRGVIGGRDPETARYFLRHLTLVSGGTIYIDGSLLRDNLGGDPAGDSLADNSAAAAQVRGRSTIALLAKEYVTVNTTQFLKPGDSRPAAPNVAPQEGPARLSANPGALDNLTFQVMNNVPVNTYDGNGRITGLTTVNYATNPAFGPQRFYVRQASADAPPDGANVLFTMNQSVVGGFIQDNVFSPGAPLPPGPFPVVGDGANGPAGVWLNTVLDVPAGMLFPTNGVPYAAPTSVGMTNQGKVLYDRPNSTSDYLLSRLGVSPLDVRVEALMYAQEGSFFIIPGPWLNANPNDTYLRYMMGDAVSGYTLKRDGENAVDPSAPTPQPRIHPRYPFYGEPQDIRLTFFGAISENLPAEIGDQGSWLEKWGWVPRYQGSMGLPSDTNYPPQTDPAGNLPTVHGPINPALLPGPLGRGAGIVYSFDDRLLLPYAGDGSPLRADGFGRVLPAAPRLPVAPGMIYSGEKTR